MTTLFLFVVIWIASMVLSVSALWLPGRLKKGRPPTVWICLVTMLLTIVLNVLVQFVVPNSPPKSYTELYGQMAASLILSLVSTAAAIYGLMKVRGRVFWACFGSYIGANILTLAFMLFVIKPFVFEAFQVPTGTMSPTIVAHDRILANKLFRPARWDVVIFIAPDQLKGQRINYVKRLVALPGEKLVIKNGGIWINGQLQTPPTMVKDIVYSSVAERGYMNPLVAEGEEVVLGSDEYFVIGDNVKNSMDSRYFGPVKKDALIGVGVFTYWPIASWKLLR